ncbi:uncharacterized protein [Pyrus communis]|uniref:uncharacterized protein n=1 Tax=Pyrus communis TaxID=23211 RepID=UPI0035C2347C
MAIMRGKSRFTMAVPPPSPIPTGRGSRSASNENFTQFLDKCLQIPELIALPPSASGTRHELPADVDFRSLSAESVARLLASAKQFGAFRISNHGISAEELGSVVRKAQSVSGNGRVIGKRFVERIGNREEIKWRPQVSEDKRYRDFCNSMEKVARKVQAIAEQLSQVFIGNKENQFEEMRSEMGNVKLLRYNHQDHSMGQNPSYLQNEIINGSQIHMRESDDEHVFCLHLPLEHSQFNLGSEGGPALLFDAGPETLVITVGRQLEVALSINV